MTREQLIETLSESMRKSQFDERDIQSSVADIADDVMGLVGNIKAEAVREGVLLLKLGMDERDLLEYADKLEKDCGIGDVSFIDREHNEYSDDWEKGDE